MEKRGYFDRIAAYEEGRSFTLTTEKRQGYWGSGSMIMALPLAFDWKQDHIVIVNLDAEVLTIQFGAHFDLSNLPRGTTSWKNAIVPSIYRQYPTVSLDFCGTDQMAESAVVRRTPTRLLEGDRVVRVVPNSSLSSGRDVFLTHALTAIYGAYHTEITRFGLEWQPDSFVLREFVFAILSIASGEAEFISPNYCRAPLGRQLPRGWCDVWFPRRGASPAAERLATFGSLFHEEGQKAGAAPAENIYWMKGVVVKVSTVVDGVAIQEAVAWGQAQGKHAFLVVVISIYEICFAEVHTGDDKQLVIRFSEAVKLSPLRWEECVALHPLTRPQSSEEAGMDLTPGETITYRYFTGTAPGLEQHYTGLAALVKFLKVAMIRGIPPQRRSALPPEILARIMSYTDKRTLEKCMRLSQTLCGFGFADFRIDEEWKIAGLPEALRIEGWEDSTEGLLYFRVARQSTGEIVRLVQAVPRVAATRGWCWLPLITGRGTRGVLMDRVPLRFDSTRPQRTIGY